MWETIVALAPYFAIGMGLSAACRAAWMVLNRKPEQQKVSLEVVLRRLQQADRYVVRMQHQEWATAFRLAAGHEWNQAELDARQAATQVRVNALAETSTYSRPPAVLQIGGKLTADDAAAIKRAFAAGGYVSGYGHPGPGGASIVPLKQDEWLQGCGCHWCSNRGRISR